MPLENYGALGDFLARTSGTGSFGKLNCIMDGDSVVNDRDSGFAGLLAVVIESGGSEVDVVGLPGKGRKAHGHVGSLEAVKTAAPLLGVGAHGDFHMLPVIDEAEGIEDLHLITVLKIDSAIAPVLAAERRPGLVGKPEFEMHAKVPVFLARLGGGDEQAVLPLSLDEVGINSVTDQDVRSGRWAFAEGWTFSAHRLRPKEESFDLRLFNHADQRRGLVPPRTGKTSSEPAHVEPTFPKGGDLDALFTFQVFALHLEIGVLRGSPGRISPDGTFWLGPEGLVPDEKEEEGTGEEERQATEFHMKQSERIRQAGKPGAKLVSPGFPGEGMGMHEACA